MRISVIEGDSGYNQWQAIDKAVIYLNGEKVYDVLTADETLGFVLVYERNSFGLYNFTEDDEIVRKKLFGRVEITFDL